MQRLNDGLTEICLGTSPPYTVNNNNFHPYKVSLCPHSHQHQHLYTVGKRIIILVRFRIGRLLSIILAAAGPTALVSSNVQESKTKPNQTIQPIRHY